MRTIKQSKFVLVIIVIFSMAAAMYSYTPLVRAASLTDAKDTISDSEPSAAGVTHIINFTTGVNLAVNDYMEVTFPGGFTNIALGNVTCPNGDSAPLVKAVNGQVVTCTVDMGDTASSAPYVITVAGVTNPATSTAYTINLATKDGDDNSEIEAIDVYIYIIDDVTVTASVDAIMTFSIAGLNAGEVVNGITTTATTTATSTPFGTLSTTGSTTVGQQLTVSTNADDGFTVTVQQDHNLQSAAGSDIDSFKDGTASTTAEAWAGPSSTLDQENTYGHLGLTSEDESLSDNDHFDVALYQGFDGTTAVEVMYHTGPTSGSDAHKGVTQVAYTAEITSLQESGDYSSTLTYICTPTY